MLDLDKDEFEATRELNKNKYKNVDIFGVKNEDNDETLKIHIPSLTQEEKNQMKNDFERIIDKYTHTVVHEKDLAVSQYIIIKQEEYIKQLESDKQKLIEKLEERRKQNNNKYGQSIDDDEFLEIYEYSGQVQEDDYILEILKGENDER